MGVVGAGKITIKRHLHSLTRIKNVELVAICDKQISLAKEAGTKLGVPAVFDDLDEMLSKESLDAVDICTPPLTHSPLAIKAMSRGCHVLVEKPMATSIKDADAMIEAAKKNDVRLGVIHQNLFNPAILKAKQLVNSGALGKLIHVELRISESVNTNFCSNKDHWSHKLPGGIFYEIMPHPVYLSQFFLEDVKPVAVVARKLSDREYMKNDELRVLLEGKNGLGAIVASCNSTIYGDTLDIFGSKKALHADLTGRSIIVYEQNARSNLSIGLNNVRLSAQLLKVLGSTFVDFAKITKGRASSHYLAINQFVQGILNDTEFTPSAEQGRATVSLLDQICTQI